MQSLSILAPAIGKTDAAVINAHQAIDSRKNFSPQFGILMARSLMKLNIA
jgi:hypothetical protein